MMGIGMLLFWGVIIFAVFLLAREAARRTGGTGGDAAPRDRTAIDILRERYARGEIDKREFEEKLADLERPGSLRRD
jgi:putative membrane protein